MTDTQEQLGELREQMARIERLLAPRLTPSPTVATDDYGNPSYVAPGEIIESAWGNSVSDRVVRVFPDGPSVGTWTEAPNGALASQLDIDAVLHKVDDQWFRMQTEVPRIWGTIPGQTVISGTAGTGPGDPRVLGLSNIYRTRGAPFQANAAVNAVNITVLEYGLYRWDMVTKHNAWWAFFVGPRQLRGGVPINGIIGSMSRGTWGNPPGVIGFDGGFTGQISVIGEFIAYPGDTFQIIGYTTGGGDGSSNVGGDGSTWALTQVRPDLVHEAGEQPPVADPVSIPDPVEFTAYPVAYIHRPGFPETYEGGVDDPDYRDV